MLEAELFAFLENTTDGVFAVRESGEICFWNRAAKDLFGYPEEEVLGKTCSELLHGVGALGIRHWRSLFSKPPGTRRPHEKA
jgi:PAS domain S-box-containing protein